MFEGITEKVFLHALEFFIDSSTEKLIKALEEDQGGFDGFLKGWLMTFHMQLVPDQYEKFTGPAFEALIDRALPVLKQKILKALQLLHDWELSNK